MTDKEYLYWLKRLKELNLSKEDWMKIDDLTRHDILEKIRDVQAYGPYYRKNKKRNKYKDIDPYGEENWD